MADPASWEFAREAGFDPEKLAVKPEFSPALPSGTPRPADSGPGQSFPLSPGRDVSEWRTLAENVLASDEGENYLPSKGEVELAAALLAACTQLEQAEQTLGRRNDYSRKTGCDCHEAEQPFDPDYSPAYQDEYRRLWIRDAARVEAAEKERDELRKKKLEWQKRAGRAIESRKAAEARVAELETALSERDDTIQLTRDEARWLLDRRTKINPIGRARLLEKLEATLTTTTNALARLRGPHKIGKPCPRRPWMLVTTLDDDRGICEACGEVLTTTTTERVTHGRHCPCSACEREDWTRITGPCGMHGADCPAVYAPVAATTTTEDDDAWQYTTEKPHPSTTTEDKT